MIYKNSHRNKIIKLLFVFIVLTSMNVSSQENNLSEKSNLEEMIELPSLQEVYILALNNSALLKSKKKKVDQRELKIAVQKRLWLKSLQFGGNININENIDIYSYPDIDVTNRVNNLKNWYGAGISLQISLYTLLGRKKNIDIAKIDYDIEQHIYEDNLQAFRNKINEIYLDVKMKQEVYSLRMEALGVANITHEYAELELKNNTMKLVDYSSIHETKVKMQVSYHQSKKNYILALAILEEQIGIKLR